MAKNGKMKKIVVIGEVLVEIMADNAGDGFKGPIALTGPYPSGAPAIFIDQVARMGQPCAIVSTVGNDDFGRVNTDRLKADGVDISAISIDPDRPTGSAFVRYRANGSRDFVFNIKHSACGAIHRNDETEKVLASADHLHIMGSCLSSGDYVDVNLRTARDVKARGGTVSFDPNLRKEILASADITSIVKEILSTTDLYLPSGDEILLLTDAANAEQAAGQLFQLGIQAIAHKLGATGACYYDQSQTRFVKAFPAQEVDPTGAGDCFGGAFTALWLRNEEPQRALTLAAAAGARAVSVRGPMEGTSHLKELERFMDEQQEKA